MFDLVLRSKMPLLDPRRYKRLSPNTCPSAFYRGIMGRYRSEAHGSIALYLRPRVPSLFVVIAAMKV